MQEVEPCLEHDSGMEELELRRSRITSYRSQARYALARNYDQLAREQELQP